MEAQRFESLTIAWSLGVNLSNIFENRLCNQWDILIRASFGIFWELLLQNLSAFYFAPLYFDL